MFRRGEARKINNIEDALGVINSLDPDRYAITIKGKGDLPATSLDDLTGSVRKQFTPSQLDQRYACEGVHRQYKNGSGQVEVMLVNYVPSNLPSPGFIPYVTEAAARERQELTRYEIRKITINYARK